jgi:hypothetical protein
VDPGDGIVTVEAEAALAPHGRLEQTQLFIEVHGADGLADRLGKLPYSQQFLLFLGHLGSGMVAKPSHKSDLYVRVLRLVRDYGGMGQGCQ